MTNQFIQLLKYDIMYKHICIKILKGNKFITPMYPSFSKILIKSEISIVLKFDEILHISTIIYHLSYCAFVLLTRTRNSTPRVVRIALRAQKFKVMT